MSRYDPPDPKCNHADHAARVSSHKDLVGAKGPTASTWVCFREDCIEDAKAWVWALTHRNAVLFRKEMA